MEDVEPLDPEEQFAIERLRRASLLMREAAWLLAEAGLGDRLPQVIDDLADQIEPIVMQADAESAEARDDRMPKWPN